MKKIITIRHKDWETLQENFIIPQPARTIDFKGLKLKKTIIVPNDNHYSCSNENAILQQQNDILVEEEYHKLNGIEKLFN